ncbi:MAG: hypothetical protein ABR562_07595, partial [Thermoplasmatota archaeon]
MVLNVPATRLWDRLFGASVWLLAGGFIAIVTGSVLQWKRRENASPWIAVTGCGLIANGFDYPLWLRTFYPSATGLGSFVVAVALSVFGILFLSVHTILRNRSKGPEVRGFAALASIAVGILLALPAALSVGYHDSYGTFVLYVENRTTQSLPVSMALSGAKDGTAACASSTTIAAQEEGSLRCETAMSYGRYNLNLT